MEKHRKIFDDDGVMVEAVETVKKEDDTAEVPMRRTARIVPKTVSVKVTDVMDSFAGYLPSQASFTEGDNKGACVLCGKETTTELRKVCFDCLKSHAMELHHAATDAIMNGEKDFTINI